MKIQAVVVQGDGEGEETMVLHQDPCRKQANDERFQIEDLGKEKEKLDINFPDTPPPTPYRDDFFPQPPNTPRNKFFIS